MNEEQERMHSISLKGCPHCGAAGVSIDGTITYKCGRSVRWDQNEECWDVLQQCSTVESLVDADDEDEAVSSGPATDQSDDDPRDFDQMAKDGELLPEKQHD